MWPSDQRLEGDMMTYRGRGHTQVKVGLLSNTNTENNTAARQNHSKDRAAAWQQHGSKVLTLVTAWECGNTKPKQE